MKYSNNRFYRDMFQTEVEKAIKKIETEELKSNLWIKFKKFIKKIKLLFKKR